MLLAYSQGVIKAPIASSFVILLMLKALIQHTPMDAAESPHMYANSVSVGGKHFILGDVERVPFENRIGGDKKILALQTSFKARSGPLQYNMGSAFGTGSTPMPAGSNESGLPPQKWLCRTRLILGRVLDSSALGKTREYSRLVPIVINIDKP